MNILFIDTETTGVDSEKHSIIEIGAALYVDGKLVKDFRIDMKPEEGSALSLEALQVNGNTISSLESKPDRSVGLTKFMEFILDLRRHYDGKLFLCGHNVHFDLAFIKKLLRDYNIEEWDKVVSYRIIDTNTIGRFLVDTGVIHVPENVPRGTGLENLALNLGIEVRGRKLHTALEDVKLTAEVYYAMQKLVEEIANGKVKN